MTCIEITHGSIEVLAESAGLSLALERGENGRLTASCRGDVTAKLRAFFEKHGRAGRSVFCGIGARGVSLRRVTLPAASGEELKRLLLLQIEREFPLGPDHLAWGFQPANGGDAPRNGSPKTQQVVVAAIKKDLLQEYSDVLTAAGLRPSFTVGAFVRTALVPSPPDSYVFVDATGGQAEVLTVEHGVPGSLRTIGSSAVEAPNGAGEARRAQAVTAGGATGGSAGLATPVATRPAVDSLTALFVGEARPRKIYLTTDEASAPDAAARLAAAGIVCETLEYPRGAGRSAGTLGLAKLLQQRGTPPLLLELTSEAEVATRSRRAFAGGADVRKWAAIAAALLLLCVGLRYAEALVQRPRLSRRIAEIKAYRDKLPNVERDLAFLQYLKTNQPHYLDAIAVLAEAAPSGTRVESLSLTRHGDLSVRASVRDAQQLTDLRAKLIRSDLFSSVVVEEQTPGQQKLNVRFTGQWKPFAEQKAGSSAGSRPDAAKESTGRSTPQTRAAAMPSPGEPTAVPTATATKE